MNGNNTQGFKDSKNTVIITASDESWLNIEPEDYDELKKRQKEEFKSMKDENFKKLAGLMSSGVSTDSLWGKISSILQLKKKQTMYSSVN